MPIAEEIKRMFKVNRMRTSRDRGDILSVRKITQEKHCDEALQVSL